MEYAMFQSLKREDGHLAAGECHTSSQSRRQFQSLKREDGHLAIDVVSLLVFTPAGFNPSSGKTAI